MTSQSDLPPDRATRADELLQRGMRMRTRSQASALTRSRPRALTAISWASVPGGRSRSREPGRQLVQAGAIPVVGEVTQTHARSCCPSASTSERSDDPKTESDVVAIGAKQRRRQRDGFRRGAATLGQARQRRQVCGPHCRFAVRRRRSPALELADHARVSKHSQSAARTRGARASQRIGASAPAWRTLALVFGHSSGICQTLGIIGSRSSGTSTLLERRGLRLGCSLSRSGARRTLSSLGCSWLERVRWTSIGAAGAESCHRAGGPTVHPAHSGREVHFLLGRARGPFSP